MGEVAAAEEQHKTKLLDYEEQLEKAAAAEKDCKRKVREHKRCVDQMSLAEKRCQIDKSDLQNQLKQSQEERRQDAAEFNTRIINITAELNRCKNLLRETESLLNAANHTVNDLLKLRTIQEELTRCPGEIKNPAVAGMGANIPHALPNSNRPPVNVRDPAPVTTVESIDIDFPGGASGGKANEDDANCWTGAARPRRS